MAKKTKKTVKVTQRPITIVAEPGPGPEEVAASLEPGKNTEQLFKPEEGAEDEVLLEPQPGSQEPSAVPSPPIDQEDESVEGRLPAQADDASDVTDEEIQLALQEDLPEEASEAMKIREALGKGDTQTAAKLVIADFQRKGKAVNAWDRIKANLGRTPKEMASTLVDKFGEGNVRVKGNRVEIRTDPNSPFELLDEEGASFSDFLDILPDIAEGIIATAVELGIVGAATVATGGFPAATIAAVPLAIGAGTVAGRESRQFLLGLAGGETEDTGLAQDLLLAYGLAGLTGFARIGSKFASKTVETFIDFLPKNRVEQLAVINKILDDVVSRNQLFIGAKKTGEKSKAVILDLKDFLGKKIDLFKREAINRAADKRFVPEEFFRTLSKEFNERGVYLKEIPTSDGSKFRFRLDENDTIFLESEILQSLETTAKIGNEILEKIETQGGLTMKEMLDLSENLGRTHNAALDAAPGQNDKVAAFFSTISGGAATDKNNAMVQALEGTRMADQVKGFMGEFADKIGDMGKFLKMFDKGESGEAFIKNVFRPNNSERIRIFKSLIGEHTKMWHDVRSNYLTGVLDVATDSTTGIFNAKNFLDEINKLGREGVEEVFTKSEMGQLRKAAIDFSGIDLAELTKTDKLKELTGLLSLFSPFRNAMLKGVWILTRSNAKAADFLLDRGFIEMAEKATTASEKSAILRNMNRFRNLLNTSIRVERGSKDVYILTPLARNILKGAAGPGQTTQNQTAPETTPVDEDLLFDEEDIGRSPQFTQRQKVENPDGTFSTERSITVTDPNINDGKPTNIPSMFGGKQVSQEEAIKAIVDSGGKDPETGRKLKSFKSIPEAEKAARARSESIGREKLAQ